MLRVAVPNKGTLTEPAATMLREAGYRQRHESRDLTVVDLANDVEFFFLRPKDIAVYVGSGELDLGHHRRDLGRIGRRCRAARARFRRLQVPVRGARDGQIRTIEDLEGKRIATSYPNLVRATWPAPGSAPRSSSSTARWRSRCNWAWPTPSPTSCLRPHAAPARPRRVRRADRGEPGHADRGNPGRTASRPPRSPR